MQKNIILRPISIVTVRRYIEIHRHISSIHRYATCTWSFVCPLVRIACRTRASFIRWRPVARSFALSSVSPLSRGTANWRRKLRDDENCIAYITQVDAFSIRTFVERQVGGAATCILPRCCNGDRFRDDGDSHCDGRQIFISDHLTVTGHLYDTQWQTFEWGYSGDRWHLGRFLLHRQLYANIFRSQ